MVAIKDFGMPSRCENCNMCDNRNLDTFYCCITLNDVNIDEKAHDCPLVEIGERKVGKWEYKQLGFRRYGLVCTSCGYAIHIGYDFNSMEEFKDMIETKLQNPHITKDKYCCKCGAEMRGAENEIN